MSTAELSAPRGDVPAGSGSAALAAHARPRNGVLTWLRLLGSEEVLLIRLSLIAAVGRVELGLHLVLLGLNFVWRKDWRRQLATGGRGG